VQALLGDALARHHRAHDADRNLHILAQHFRERRAFDAQQARRRLGQRRRVARQILEHGGFAEEIARSERGRDFAVAGRMQDVDLPRLDHVHLVAGVAFLEHRGTGLKFDERISGIAHRRAHVRSGGAAQAPIMPTAAHGPQPRNGVRVFTIP